jgi:Uma2 family endonuclease
MATAPDVRSLADFLAWERQQSERYEWVSGVVRMMTGGTIDHNRIIRNVSEALARGLQGRDCEVFTSDVKVVSPAADLMYPDVVVAADHSREKQPRSTRQPWWLKCCPKARRSGTKGANVGPTG